MRRGFVTVLGLVGGAPGGGRDRLGPALLLVSYCGAS